MVLELQRRHNNCPLLKCFEVDIICRNTTHTSKHIRFNGFEIVHQKLSYDAIARHECFHILVNRDWHTVNRNRKRMLQYSASNYH